MRKFSNTTSTKEKNNVENLSTNGNINKSNEKNNVKNPTTNGNNNKSNVYTVVL